MSTSEKFCLRWNEFESNISVAFKDIREEKDFFDCTLSCGAMQIQAHKLILSACSPFFKSILKKNPHQHPLLYLKGVEFTDLQSVLDFMYHGEVNVAQEELNSFLSVAEDLQVKGLTQTNTSNPPKQKSVSIPRKPLPPKQSEVVSKHSLPPLATSHPPYQPHDEVHVEEVLPVVKTEPQHAYGGDTGLMEPISTQGEALETMGTELASIEESYVEEEYEDYGVYEGQEYHATGQSKGMETESSIAFINDNFECTLCGRGFPLKITCRRHIQTVHTGDQKVLCHVCNKLLKNNASLKTHLRGAHGIYQGGKSGSM